MVVDLARMSCTLNHLLMIGGAVSLLLMPAGSMGQEIESPVPVDNRLRITSVVTEPQLVTPTAIAVDRDGSTLVIECHTHFRPDDYQGPNTDRILRLRDLDHDGRAEKVTVAYEGSVATMGLAVEQDGAVLVATRGEIFRLRDQDADGRYEQRDSLARLETRGDYPHNGLSGFAIDVTGEIFFGFGENLGEPYALIGTDGRQLTGGGEGGSIFRMRPDGSGLERWATGFWNPFHLAIDDFGRLFAVDNDPDWRPPCRLIHVVKGGDYGYRFALGRRGTHPFTTWFGDRPDRLGMVAGTGEAPSGIVSYRGSGLTDADDGSLIATAWGLHTLERFRLIRHGATFTSQAEIRVKGGEDFRPVGVAIASDGSLMISDWVKRSYPLHGYGRVWRIAGPSANTQNWEDPWTALSQAPDRDSMRQACEKLFNSDPLPKEKFVAWLSDAQVEPWRRAVALTSAMQHAQLDRDDLVRVLRVGGSIDLAVLSARFASRFDLTIDDLTAMAPQMALSPEVVAEWLRHASDHRHQARLRVALEDEDPWVRQAAISVLAAQPLGAIPLEFRPGDSEAVRIGLACAAARRDDAASRAMISAMLSDASNTVRWVALRWIAEAKLTEFRDRVERELSVGRPDGDRFEAVLATLEQLDGAGGATFEGGQVGLLDAYVIGQRKLPAAVLPAALTKLDRIATRDRTETLPQGLSLEHLRSLLGHADEAVRLAAVRVLRQRHPEREGADVLARVAAEATQPEIVRFEAMAGIDHIDTLMALASSDPLPGIREEAMRALEGLPITAEHREQLRNTDTTSPRHAAALARLVTPGEDARPEGTDVTAWLAWLSQGEAGDAARGERWFHHPRLGRCGACHVAEGRGGAIGPDLTRIGGMGRERLLESLLQPSREIAPRYTAWVIETEDGSIRSGLLDTERGELQFYVDSTGNSFQVDHDEIVSLAASDRSLMPDNLLGTLTRDEIADLIAFLESLR